MSFIIIVIIIIIIMVGLTTLIVVSISTNSIIGIQDFSQSPNQIPLYLDHLELLNDYGYIFLYIHICIDFWTSTEDRIPWSYIIKFAC